jgi:uncharacterized membrane protein YbhN (UPF0104 family)
MLRCLSHRMAYRRCVAPMMISIAMNSLLPFRAGDMARVVAFKSLKVNASLLLSTLIVERILDLMVLLGLFFLALQWMPSSGIPSELTEGATWLTVIALIAVCGVLLMPGVARRLIRWTGARLPRAGKPLSKIDQFLQGIEVLCKPRDAVKLVALTGLMWLLEAGVFVAVGKSLGLVDQASRAFLVLPHSRCIWPHRRRWAFRCYMRADDFAAKFLKVTEGGTYLHRECGRAAFFSMTTATLSTLIPSLPGYIGTFHYFSMQGLMAFGTGADAAAAFAIVVHLLLWLPPTLVGLIFLSLIWK